MDNGLQFFWTVAFGAVVVESIVTIVQNVKEREVAWKYWVSLVLGLVLGIGVAVNYDIDVFQLVGLEGQVPFVGAVLTGLILSRGANIVSDFVGRLNAWKPGS